MARRHQTRAKTSTTAVEDNPPTNRHLNNEPGLSYKVKSSFSHVDLTHDARTLEEEVQKNSPEVDYLG
jgi:hypothetical protein